MRKHLFLMIIMFLFCLPHLLAQTDPVELAPLSLVSILIGILTPVGVWAAAEIFKAMSRSVSGTLLILVVVPTLSAIGVGITQIIDTGIINPWLQGLLGLLAVFVSQILIQFKKAGQ